MVFEPFAPIDLPFKEKKKEGEENELIRLKREVELLKKENRELRNLIEKLKFSQNSERIRFEEEKKHLLTTIENLKAENVQLKNTIEKLQKDLEILHSQKRDLEETAIGLLKNLEKIFKEQKEEFLSLTAKLVERIVTEILKEDKMWSTDNLKRIFEDIFSEKIFKGEIVIRANPKDVDLIKSLLSKKENLVFEVIPDPSLSRGELKAETEHFFIERDLEILVKEAVPILLKELLKTKEQTQTATEEQTEH